jgi:hypothetical protein
MAEDALGSERENFKIPWPQKYYYAFERIDSDQDQELIMIENAFLNPNLPFLNKIKNLMGGHTEIWQVTYWPFIH